jgi:hypothetical protein
MPTSTARRRASSEVKVAVRAGGMRIGPRIVTLGVTSRPTIQALTAEASSLNSERFAGVCPVGRRIRAERAGHRTQ